MFRHKPAPIAEGTILFQGSRRDCVQFCYAHHATYDFIPMPDEPEHQLYRVVMQSHYPNHDDYRIEPVR